MIVFLPQIVESLNRNLIKTTNERCETGSGAYVEMQIFGILLVGSAYGYLKTNSYLAVT